MADEDRIPPLRLDETPGDCSAPANGPFLHAPEGARTIFLVTAAAACGPLLAGIVLFGWRALITAALAIAGCAAIERLYYRVTRAPAMLGRSHAYLTGVLLALTLPAFVPWYVPLAAAAFAIVVGKAVFGGVGHFLWQPALVGRLAVAVMFPAAMNPADWPVLAQSRLLTGDLAAARRVEDYRQWRGTPAPPGADAFLLAHPAAAMGGLTSRAPAPYSALVHIPPDFAGAKPAALLEMPPLSDLLIGSRPGGLGETCAVVIVAAGLYLVYRNYVKWQLPASILAAAWCVAAVGPVRLARPNDTADVVWLPLLSEGLDAGFTYVNYQLLCGELMLAAFLLAPEMTSRPVTAGGQVVFGLACGALAMLLQLYLDVPIPAYVAVLAANTFSQTIDSLWRPRVFGRRRLAFLHRG